MALDATAKEGGKVYHIGSTGGSAGEGPGKLIFNDFTSGQVIMCMAGGRAITPAPHSAEWRSHQARNGAILPPCQR